MVSMSTYREISLCLKGKIEQRISGNSFVFITLFIRFCLLFSRAETYPLCGSVYMFVPLTDNVPVNSMLLHLFHYLTSVNIVNISFTISNDNTWKRKLMILYS